jgi:hypothetical protein
MRWAARYRPYLLALAAVLLVVFLPGAGHRSTPAASGLSSGAGAGTAGGTRTLGTGPSPASSGLGSAAGSEGASGAGDLGGGSGLGGTSASAAGGSGTDASGTSATPAPTGAGIGTAAALAAPDCDRTTGRIKVPMKYAPPCVVPWLAGADNGGTTSSGVTASTIKVVALSGMIEDGNGASSSDVQQAWRDTMAVFQHTYQTWGRQVSLTVIDEGEAQLDQVQQRALATQIADMHPFAVLVGAGFTTVTQVLAQDGIITDNATASADLAQSNPPYVWTNFSAAEELTIANAANVISEGMVGHDAQWAGSATFRAQKRVFGLIYPDDADPKVFNRYLAQYGIPVKDEISYPAAQITTYQEVAPTMITRLKADGVTTVIDNGDFEFNPIISHAATSQLYFPEWFVAANGGSDISLFERTNDQQQWAHAFGIGEIALAPSGWNPQISTFDWYYGSHVPAWTNDHPAPDAERMMSNWLMLYAGIQLAGPHLTPQTFQAGMFADPPNGGSACGCITSWLDAFGPQGVMGTQNNYFSSGDYNEFWWDTSVGKEELAGTEGPGFNRYMSGGQRKRLDQWPSGPPAFFNPAGTVDGNTLTTVPPQDRTPSYPCSGCPSSQP